MKRQMLLLLWLLLVGVVACRGSQVEEARTSTGGPMPTPVAEATVELEAEPTDEPTTVPTEEATATAEPEAASAGLDEPWVRAVELPIIPHDLDVDEEGNLYVVELGAPLVHKYDAEGSHLLSWGEAGDGPGQFSFTPPPDGPPLDGGFVVAGPDGTVYVSDSYNNRVQLFDGDGAFLEMWTVRGPDEAPFNNPGPISVDDAGNVYVADFEGVHQFDAAGAYVQTLMAAGEVAIGNQGEMYTTVAFENIALKMPAGGGEPLTWGGEGMADGQFTTPMWVVAVEDGVLIADHSGRIQKFDSEGDVLAVWSDPGDGDGPFSGPSSIAEGPDGTVYVAAKDRNTVYVLQP